MNNFFKKHRTNILIMSTALVVGVAAGGIIGSNIMNDPQRAAAISYKIQGTPNTAQAPASFYRPFDNKTLSGNYLASRFAQNRHDWNKAGEFLDVVLGHDPENLIHIRRAMVIAMGAGEYDAAFLFANQLLDGDDAHPLAIMFAALQAFESQNFQDAISQNDQLEDGGLAAFVKPLITGWAYAAQGEMQIDDLTENGIQRFHAMLIAATLEEYDALRTMLDDAVSGHNTMTAHDTARIADLYAHIGQRDTALDIYRELIDAIGENEEITERMALIKSGAPMTRIHDLLDPQTGLAQAMLDMAQLLAREFSDESARIFAHSALYLRPHMTPAKLLLADVAARNEQYSLAKSYYQMIDSDDEHYLEAQRKAAAMLEDIGRLDEAIILLEELVESHRDLLSQILIGDLKRGQEQFKEAIRAYNKAETMLEDGITAEYWHLHYRRGMAYERAGKWKKAEADLKAALDFRPDDPYVLNYLAYSWADMGMHLDKSLDMLRRAFSLRPADGYISDSLGWVLYRMGRIDEGLPYLEKAAQLLPYDPTINDHLGDAYWRLGRKLEARFQWLRAKNHADDDGEIAAIAVKLEDGLPPHPKLIESAPGLMPIIDSTAHNLTDSKPDGS